MLSCVLYLLALVVLILAIVKATAAKSQLPEDTSEEDKEIIREILDSNKNFD